MEVTITISTCSQCRHFDHSGAFTKGGAQWICGHIKWINATKNFNWKLRVITPQNPTESPTEIPMWCPLKNGFPY